MIVAFEGIGGSGKTTLIQKLNEEFNFNYLREAREILNPVSYRNKDLLFLKLHLEYTMRLQNTIDNYFFDRTYLSSLAVINAKVIENKLPLTVLKEANDIVFKANIVPFSLLIICYVDPSLAIQRRDDRDKKKHDLWSDKTLVQHISNYYLEKIPKFAYKKKVVINTSSFYYDKNLSLIKRYLYDNIRN